MKSPLHRGLIAAAAVGISASLACAQSPTEAPNRPNPTWTDMQRMQSWATTKLAQSPRRQAWVTIQQGGRTLKGWVDFPSVRRKVPVVLVLHEVFGLTDSTRNTADEIAAMGYVAITPDMLSGFGPNGGDTASFENSRAASQTLTGLPDDAVNAELDAWADYADHLRQSDGRLAIVGLSWGGGAAFRDAATTRTDLKAVFVFYDVGPPAQTQGPADQRGPDAFPASRIRLPVYGFYGSKDTRVMQSLEAMRQAMQAAGKRYEPVVYEGADHAFMRVGEDPSNHDPADATAVRAARVRLQRLLRQTFK